MIPSTARKAGPFAGDNANTLFNFGFKVFAKTEVQVVKVSASGAETTLVQDSDYSISVNANQLTSPGGTVTYPRVGAGYLAAGEKLTVIGAMEYGQTASLPNGSAFNAVVIERALDRLAVLIQQVKETSSRVLSLAVNVAADVSPVLPAPVAMYMLAWDITGKKLVNTAFPAGSVAGGVNITAAGARITGDFSNATVANRVMFQTSTPATFTALSAVPTGTESYLTLYQYSDINNCSYSAMSALNTEMRLDSGKTGVGSYRPMTFYTGGGERMRIDTSGNVGVGTTPATKFHIFDSGVPVARIANTTTTMQSYVDANFGVTGTITNHPLLFTTNNIERVRIDTTGNVLVTSSGGLGYGTGAGGTVTQATSKSTAVTLNKPTGKITTAADALAPSARASFLFNNSLIGANDVLVLTPAVAGGNYNVQVIDSGTGVAYIEIFNKSGVSQSQAIDIKFAIIKGAVA